MTKRDSAVWGLVGGLAFLVAVQGFELATTQRIDFALKFAVAAIVTVVAGALVHAVRRHRRQPRSGDTEQNEQT